MRAAATIVKDVAEADMIVALQAGSKDVVDRARPGARIELPRSNTYSQIYEALRKLFTTSDSAREDFALREAEEALQRVEQENRSVELMPQNSYIRRMQHRSTSIGKEPRRRVMILPQ